MSFIQEDTWLPVADWSMIRDWANTATAWQPSYEAAHTKLLSEGWTFFDFMGTSLGSDQKLRENSDYSNPNLNPPITGNQWDHQNSGDWLVRLVPPPNNYWRFRTPAVYWFEDEYRIQGVAITMEWWKATIFGIPALLDPKKRALGGLVIREINRWFQHRVAKCIQNALGLDSRGRPPNVVA